MLSIVNRFRGEACRENCEEGCTQLLKNQVSNEFESVRLKKVKQNLPDLEIDSYAASRIVDRVAWH
jgi:hypothetical protein